MNVAGYVRVSGEEQTKNYSIPQQQEVIRNYCKARDWNILKFYIDGAFSGANTDRPALQELLSEAENFDAIIVWKIDRFSRSQRDMLNMIDLLQKKKCVFISVVESFDMTTPMGMLMLQILTAFAELEREQIKERMSLGRKGRIKKGLWRAGSNVPTGYDYIGGHLVIREDEAEQIRKIFELFLSGWTINRIKHYMHENYTNRYSSWAQASAVSAVLRNSLYIGMLPSKSDGVAYKGEHEPIIDEITFNKAQQLLKAKFDNYDEDRRHPFRAKYLLTGITYCGQCGGRVSCVTAHGYSYYGCHRRYNGDPRNRKLPKCDTAKYRTHVLEQVIIDEVLKLSYDPEAIKPLIRPRKVVDHSKAIKQLKRQKSRLIDLYAVGGIELEELTSKIDVITDKLMAFSEDKPEDPELTFQEAVDIFNNCRDILEGDDIEAKRGILVSLINKIVLVGDTVEIHWRFQ